MTTPNLLLLPETLLLIFLLFATFTDLKNNTIPNYLTYPGIIIGLFIQLITTDTLNTLTAFFGMLAGGIILLPAYISGRMAAGDIKLMAMCGAFLGFPLICINILLSSIFGGLYTIITLIIFKFSKSKTLTPKYIPFAPSITCGTITTLADPTFIHPLKSILSI